MSLIIFVAAKDICDGWLVLLNSDVRFIWHLHLGGRHWMVTFCVGIKLLLPWTLLLWKLSRDELNVFPAWEKLTDQLR